MVQARTGGAVDALMLTSGHLALAACSGAWQAPATVPVHHGIVGRVLATGRPVAIGDGSIEYAGLHPGRPVGSVICVPLHEPTQPPLGVLNVEFDHHITHLPQWSHGLADVARRLGQRIQQLGGPPAQSRAEKLLQHTLAFAAATDGMRLAAAACRAAVELTGLCSATILVRRRQPSGQPQRPRLRTAAYTAPGARDLPAYVTGLPPGLLGPLIEAACRHGPSQTFGDPADLDARGFEPLITAGVRTLIAVPVTGVVTDPLMDAAMLVMDEVAVRVQHDTVNILELLIANAVVCHDRLKALRQLQTMAESDPLTGLRHLGPFTERLKTSRAGRTALLVIDIDDFKQVNDNLGHAEGDRLLVAVAAALRQALRAGDEVFRTGGDEFVAVLEVPDGAEATRVANRLVAAAQSIGQKISVGVALRHADESAQATLRRADQAMYAAKNDPRSAVRLAD